MTDTYENRVTYIFLGFLRKPHHQPNRTATMPKTRKPILVAATLSVATLMLVGGTVAASTLQPTEVQHSSPLAAVPVTSPPSVPPPPSPSASPARAPAPTKKPGGETITYVVKPGDTLSDIAAWFEQQGYQDLYRANRKVIGSDPDLIRPGQRFTVREGVMSMDEPS